MVEHVQCAFPRTDLDLEALSGPAVVEGDGHTIGRRVPEEADVEAVVAAMGEFANMEVMVGVLFCGDD